MADVTEGGTPRHVPVFYCPYCAEEDIRPYDGGPGQWLCAGCRRVWSVRFVGLVDRYAGDAAGAPAGWSGSERHPSGGRTGEVR
jgi:hypothetical protein